jgi:phosphoribosyl-AMP cyclohydrolase
MTSQANYLEALHFNDQGLIPAIAQDADTQQVLMVAWMNREAVEKTVATGEAHYFSRSRAALWHKGESSGHTQRVKEIRLDCDGDVLLLLVDQSGGIACHTGRESCFFLRLSGEHWDPDLPVLKDSKEIYSHD